MFRFLLGPQQEEYDVDISFFSDILPEFEAVMDNAGPTRTCVLDDVDNDIFNDLSNFA